MFAAAMTANTALRLALISKVFNGSRAAGPTNPAFAVYYDTADGTPLRGVAR